MTPLSSRKHSRHIRAVVYLQIVFAVSFLFEAAACRTLFSSPQPATQEQWIYAAILHTLAAIVPLSYAHRPDHFPGIGWYLPKFTGLMTFFLPVMGVVGMFLTINLTKLLITSKGLAHDFDQHAMHLSGVEEVAINRTMDDMLREELSTQPIVDILLGDDDDLKRGAIMLLKRMKSPRAIQLLKDSLSDASTEVRFFAHTALTQLEEDAVGRLEKAEELASSGGSKAIRAFADACRDYAQSGLPEDSMRRYYLEEARKHYQHYSSKEKQDHYIHHEIGLINLELGDYNAALDIYTVALDYPDTLILGRLGRCRVFFEQRNWVQLSREMSIMRAHTPEKDDSDDFSRALYVFWAQEKDSIHAKPGKAA